MLWRGPDDWQTPPGSRYQQCPSQTLETLALGKITWPVHAPRQSHERLIGRFTSRLLEKIADDPALGHTALPRRDPKPAGEIFWQTHSDRITHLTKVYSAPLPRATAAAARCIPRHSTVTPPLRCRNRLLGEAKDMMTQGFSRRETPGSSGLRIRNAYGGGLAQRLETCARLGFFTFHQAQSIAKDLARVLVST